MKKVKIAINTKHPNGAMWIQSGNGHAILEDADVREDLGISKDIVSISGDLTITDEAFDSIVSRSKERFEQVLDDDPGCAGCPE